VILKAVESELLTPQISAIFGLQTITPAWGFFQRKAQK